MPRLVKFLTLITVVTLSSLSYAGHYFDYAKVTNVEPVYETVRVSTPEKTCYRVREKHHHYNPVPTFVGAVVGGVIGHAIGDTRYTRRVGTIAGTGIGASIGHDISRHNSYSTYHTTRHCEVSHYRQEKVRELRGYSVQYRYKGDVHHAFMKSHPGDKIKVKVKVIPAH